MHVTLFHATMQYRSEYHLWYPPLEGLTPWFSKSTVWGGLWSVASFMVRLLNEAYRLDESARLDFFSNLVLHSEVLLESYSNAIAAKVERREEHRTLLEEYWKRRDALLDSLYQQVKRFVQAKIQGSADENEEQVKDALRELSSRILPVAKGHESYQTMWNICCDLDDSELLRSLVRESMGPTGGFSNFVFNQLYESKQFSKLIRLGEEFHEELTTFLKQHTDLLWLHEVYICQFSSASETLLTLSLSKDDTSISASEEIESDGWKSRLTLANRKHFINLAKISAMAGKDKGHELKLKRIEADLKILQLQEEILKVVPDNEEKQSVGHNLISPVDLIDSASKLKTDLSHYVSLRFFHGLVPPFLKITAVS